jgi:glycosyltransferase involved in cell wall biosynthesis
MLDLVRELDALGAEVSFYSYVPVNRAEAFGLRRRCHVALLPFVFPLVALQRLLPGFLPALVERLMCWALDLAVIGRLRRCDVFVCMSGIYVLAAKYARWRYGALVHLHRSSKHILSQKEILEKIPMARQIPQFMVARELQGYEIADHIIVPSSHVKASFESWPYAGKVFLNPLGVDIDQFQLYDPPAADPPTVIFVGQWSYRKGVDILEQAIKQMSGVHLLHVGALADARFPDSDPKFSHVDHVSQDRLKDFYCKSHVLVLPSREDGFGVVLSQALASGLKVVCTDQTGGPDLARLSGFQKHIYIVPSDDVSALRLALERALADVIEKRAETITESERRLLGWSSYAARDLDFMRRVWRRTKTPELTMARQSPVS